MMSFFGTWMPLIGVLAVLDVILKGIALWFAARNSQKYWFVALLIVNSAGILPIIYLLWFAKKTKKS